MPPLAPKDRTKREHVGKVDRVVWCDPSQPYCILALEDGHAVKGPFDAEQFARGTAYRFLGRWQDDDRRGPQFHASTYVVHQVGGKLGTVRYLTKAAELSEANARRLFDAFGSDAVAVLRDRPADCQPHVKLTADQLEEASALLKYDAATAGTKVELHELFAGRGFHGELIQRAVSKWGVHAPRLVRKNPFCLLPLGGGAGFKRCDKLWTDLGLPPDSLKRQVFVATQIAARDRDGNTYLAAADLAAKLLELIPRADTFKAFRLALRARMLKKYRDGSGTWLGTYPRVTAEERVADSVRRLLASPPLWPTDRVNPGADGKPSVHQVETIRRATTASVGLFLGGPGTGKTTTLGYLLREVIEIFGKSSVVIAAPTGKAGVRATQALALAGLSGIRATTIHRLLEIGRAGHDGGGWDFQRNRDNPLDARFVVIDESSMINTDLMADLLDACADGTSVLLIGDPGQLPPVEHGAPLRDLVASGAVPVGELTEVRRNAGQIVHACLRIRNDEDFETTEQVDLDADPPRNLRLIEARDERHAADLVEQVLRGMQKFDPVWQTQVVVARNRVRTELNARLHPVLNPDGHAVRGNPFKVGDKIICLKNSRMHRVESVSEDAHQDAGLYQVVAAVDEFTGAMQPAEVFVANGEIGRVEAVAEKPSVMVARFSEGEALVRIPVGRQQPDDDGPRADGEAETGRGCNFDLAYAVTCHRLQGSEAPCVIVVGDEGAVGLCSREWIYTAVSRASKLCILIGRKPVFRRMAGRVALSRRKTFLAERLREVQC